MHIRRLQGAPLLSGGEALLSLCLALLAKYPNFALLVPISAGTSATEVFYIRVWIGSVANHLSALNELLTGKVMPERRAHLQKVCCLVIKRGKGRGLVGVPYYSLTGEHGVGKSAKP